MPLRTVPGTDLSYALIAFDKEGDERDDDPDGPDGRLSERILELLAEGSTTDIFFASHGWQGDMPAAVAQYDRWFAAMDGLVADKTRLAEQIPGFRPMRIGLHWPSRPWGDEELGPAEPSFAAMSVPPEAEMVERWVARLGDTPEIRESLRVIFEEARHNAAADALPPAARDAYARLDAALDLGDAGEGAPPGADREPFDPDVAFASGQLETVSFGDFDFGGILGPLRQLSFYKMKRRARAIGEDGMHRFLTRLQEATAERPARMHLMGHSFGCIVVSAMLGGPGGDAPLARPVQSVVLVQGALSLWSYCPSIPEVPDKPGYFHRVIADGKIAGPIVTTRSRFDTAVGRFYPIAAGVAGQVAFAPDQFPKYGGIGAFGIQGLAAGIVDRAMLPTDQPYQMEPGTVYNLESSDFIRTGDGPSGAHSDIAGPEVAHAIWSAAEAGAMRGR